jgi:type II secretory pathway pseudopilin PulG
MRCWPENGRMDEFASRKFPIREDMRFQRRSWIVERAGWALLVVIALIGLSGAFGIGPLSWQTAKGGSLSVEYERFQRITRLARFTFNARGQSGPELQLHLSDGFQKNFEVSNIQPQPARSTTGPEGIDLSFATNGADAGRIVIWAHSRHYGVSDITAQLGGEPPVSFWVFVYP